MSAEVKEFGPLYLADIKLYMGKDSVWKREENRSIHRVLQARAPDAIWQETAANLMEMLGFTDSRFVMGLFLNMINRWPDEDRIQMMMGILEGWGLTIDKDVGSKELVVTVGEKRGLDGELLFKPIMKVSPEGDMVLPSGLIIPKTGVPA